MTKSPAIFYHPDAVERDGAELVGRRAAGQSFARAFLTHIETDCVNAVVSTKQHAKAFNTFARDAGEDRAIEVAVLQNQHDFTKFGTVFLPTPGMQSLAWRRARGDQRRCSLVGITHTVSTRRIIEGLHSLVSEPVQPWDAIICTSRAVQSVVKAQFAMEADFIRERFGATRVPLPQLPVVPLGIHTDDFTPVPDMRAKMRAQYGVGEDDVVVMTMGRLTSVEKANPVPLYMALERIAQAQAQPVHLWVVGWANRESETTLHKDGAAQLCPSVAVQFIDGRIEDARRHIWSGADIFTLPVDNIQETFGLAPVEAMAAGLPVVMPDWNGFRDTVVDGETGYLVPTMMPAPDQKGGEVLASRFADGADDYLRHLSIMQQQIQIDVPAYTAALDALIGDKGLRRRMGHAAQKHARAQFDWARVMPQYVSLAAELKKLRDRADPVATVQNPMEGSPFHLYGAYPTQHLLPSTQITHVRGLDQDALSALDALNGRTLYHRKIASDDKTLRIAAYIAEKGALTFGELLSGTQSAPHVIAGIVMFLGKYDFVTLGPQVPK